MALTEDSPSRQTRSSAAAEAAEEDEDMQEVSSEDEDDANDGLDEPLPTAVGPVATMIAQVPLEEQKTETTRLLDFFQQTKPDFFRLNGEQGALTAIIHVPTTMLVRLVYGIAVNNPGLKPGLLDNKPVCLVGDIADQRTTPDAMRLYANHMTAASIFVPKIEWIKNGMDSPTDLWPLVKGTKFESERTANVAQIHRVCPIPPFLVLDGFERDIDIRVLYRRIKTVDDQSSAWVTHALSFLRACTLQPKANTSGTALPTAVFAERRGKEITEWSRLRIHQLCPTLTPTNTSTNTSHTTTPSPSLPHIIAQLLAAQKATTTAPAAPPTPPPPEDTPAGKLGMAPSELKRLLRMCGLEEHQEEFLPAFYNAIAEKNLSKEGKNLIIREVCNNANKYEDAPIPLLAPLLKTIRHREWSGDSGVHTMVSAMKGLSPFLLLEISEEAQAAWNEQYELLEASNLYTMDDLKKTTKLEAKVPTSYNDLRQCMKTFGNLLFALFGPLCPLLLELHAIIIAMGKFSSHEKAAMLHKNRAALMWVLFLQTRAFTGGTMVKHDPTTHLPAFMQMKLDILAAKEVTNTSVPLQLRQDPTQKKRRQPDTDDDPAKTGATGSGDNPTKKKPRLVNSNQKLIQAFKPIFADNPTASIKAMCELSTCKVNQLFPNDKRRCVLGALKGECTYATCRNTHNYTVTDNEAEHILTLLQPIIDDPGKLSRVSR